MPMRLFHLPNRPLRPSSCQKTDSDSIPESQGEEEVFTALPDDRDSSDSTEKWVAGILSFAMDGKSGRELIGVIASRYHLEDYNGKLDSIPPQHRKYVAESLIYNPALPKGNEDGAIGNQKHRIEASQTPFSFPRPRMQNNPLDLGNPFSTWARLCTKVCDDQLSHDLSRQDSTACAGICRCLRDVKAISDFKLTFLTDDEGIVRHANITANLGEPCLPPTALVSPFPFPCT